MLAMAMLENPIAWMFLLPVLAFYVLDWLSNSSGSQAEERPLPKELAGVYPASERARMRAYQRANARTNRIESTIRLAVFLGFWFLRGFGWLDRFVRDLHLGTMVAGLLFFALLFGGRALVAFPFAAYRTFGIEQQFGFNRTTLATFFSDAAKALVLTGVLGGGVLAGVLALFEHGGRWAWLFGWALVGGAGFLIMWLAPPLLLPLFNRFRPLEEGELRRALLDCARDNLFLVEDIVVMDGSRRSAKVNAFFTGLGRTRTIALFDTLIHGHPVSEVLAVVAHEIAHSRRRHVLKQAVLPLLELGLFFYLSGKFIDSPWLYAVFGVEKSSIHGGLLLVGVLYGPVSRLFSIAAAWISRRHEYEADRLAARARGGSDAMIAALARLAAKNLAILDPHPLKIILHGSHPPIPRRIVALQAEARRGI